jgi:serine/threonine protein kinase/tetratricopeptide (TPR) repeat protein
MGTVYLAYDSLLDREVALKVLPREPGKVDPQFSARFLAEAVLTGKLSHAGIVPIYSVGHDPEYGYYYTMRKLCGTTLGQIIDKLSARDPKTIEEFPLTRRLAIFSRVCEALSSAHRHGIIHRDIKPANIMVGEFGEVFVLDWGLAKDITPGGRQDAQADPQFQERRRKRDASTRMFLSKDENRTPGRSYLQQLRETRPVVDKGGSTHVTRFAQIMGTPGYLSPEQGNGASNITPASDVYSLGVVLYELLVSQSPIEGSDPDTVIAKTVMGQIVPLNERPEAAHVSKRLQEIVNRALATDPVNRFADAGEIGAEIALYMEGKTPWRLIAQDNLRAQPEETLWKYDSTLSNLSSEGFQLNAGARMFCRNHSKGDFRCNLEFWSQVANQPWVFNLGIAEPAGAGGNAENKALYNFRIGSSARPFIELLHNGKCVQRRLDVRLQSGQRYILRIELELDYLRLWIDDKKCIEYREIFPQPGGAIELHCESGSIGLQDFQLFSRGAPLNLSFMVLPDRLFQMGRFTEARELYRQLSVSHPDREEGLIGHFKAGLCSTKLGDQQDAFGEFTKLENTALDHCCALGFAEVGMLDGNVEWAWQALKNGFQRHRARQVRGDLWFALLSVIEHLPANLAEEKISRYRELVAELDPEPQELGRATFDLLDHVHRKDGIAATRAEVLRLLQSNSDKVHVMVEALLAIGRTGVGTKDVPVLKDALEKVLQHKHGESTQTRLLLLRAELCLATGDYNGAAVNLRDVTHIAPGGGAEALWARCWQLLLLYLKGDFQTAITQSHEVLARYRRFKYNLVGYVRLLEALSYLGKRHPGNAQSAFNAAATVDCIWGWAAQAVIDKSLPAALYLRGEKCAPNQLVEALFLVGEAHKLGGDPELAESCFELCLKPPFERAMIGHAIISRHSSFLRRPESDKHHAHTHS